VVAASQIFRFNTEQCLEDAEKAQEAIEECAVICGCMWETSAVTLRFWDSLDGPWIDDWSEATNDSFYLEIESDDD